MKGGKKAGGKIEELLGLEQVIETGQRKDDDECMYHYHCSYFNQQSLDRVLWSNNSFSSIQSSHSVSN